MVYGYVLKADIKRYFDSVDHEVMMQIISRKINDDKILWLIRKILDNHRSVKGMPIGNLTSQFFANVYLNELDYFVKHQLKAKYYIRYVDDFVLLDISKEKLEKYKTEIDKFLKLIKLELHPQKSKVMPLHKGVKFLGFRIFYRYKLPKESNLRTAKKRIEHFTEMYKDSLMTKDDIFHYLSGWNAYAMHASTYKFRRAMMKNLRKSLQKIDMSSNS